MTDATKTITDTITKNSVVLFMKGTKSMPQCGRGFEFHGG